MLNHIFFTMIFFTLDHFFIFLIFNLISLIVMKYVYKKWHDTLIALDVRHLSLIILISLAIILALFLMVIIYVISIFVLNFHEIRKLSGRW
jgi:hypothetical protein